MGPISPHPKTGGDNTGWDTHLRICKEEVHHTAHVDVPGQRALPDGHVDEYVQSRTKIDELILEVCVRNDIGCRVGRIGGILEIHLGPMLQSPHQNGDMVLSSCM